MSLVGKVENDSARVYDLYEKMSFIASGTGGTQDIILDPICGFA